ncbi:histidinol dehydrogenase [Cytobacillus kochii]|uniref:histidinol dehydrogenase n=1 Tax=Cytobacillus kochii TaxID=859143 RepID=UPI001CD3F7A0|nr:histidinol dehydrogenase [Cytobacillus kochii]MCA1026754.1 histidinol dehydrogenase [Cytobacillus kochii]MCM3322822.1 histidinol dehydrogenase [Cytobacillus kochii]MCM3344699.1 histidinol dehydrogenase [Cytobacillus kochii]MDM5209241.1 histidinol dehydrogenase [Cytobacillus kochii]
MDILKVTNDLSIKRSIDGGTEEQRQTVKEIIAAVRQEGDQAIIRYTEKFDGILLDDYQVKAAEIDQAYRELSKETISIIKEAAENIRNYHMKQLQNSWMTTEVDGTLLGQKITPIDSVGVYVPGGKAAYPSSVLMNVLPAKVAGVERIVMVSPVERKTGKIPSAVLVAANIAGVTDIYKVGGAQAVAALAYGTETIAPVDKITGPGNIYVALAKREVYGEVDIDMIAGPSEIAILADDSAIPTEVAADLLSQAEHDEMACSILVTNSEQLANEVAIEVEEQLATLPKYDIASQSIQQFGRIYVTETIEESIAVINTIAPEHLEVLTVNPLSLLGAIRHAGAIFLGRYSPEPVGDYFAGPNHVLPTNGTARFSSPLNVDDFRKKSSIIYYSESRFTANAEKIASFARLEGLEAHARSIEKRLQSERKEGK